MGCPERTLMARLEVTNPGPAGDATLHNPSEGTIIHTVGAWYDDSELLTDGCTYTYIPPPPPRGSGGSGEADNSIIGYDVTGDGHGNFISLSETEGYSNVREVGNCNSCGENIADNQGRGNLP